MKVTINWSYIEAGSCTINTKLPFEKLLTAEISKYFIGDGEGMQIDEVCEADKNDKVDAVITSRDPFGELLSICPKT